MTVDQLADELESLAVKVREQAPAKYSVDREHHWSEVPDGSSFVRRESTGGMTVRVEIVWS